jgi:hypothetical protein
MSPIYDHANRAISDMFARNNEAASQKKRKKKITEFRLLMQT